MKYLRLFCLMVFGLLGTALKGQQADFRVGPAQLDGEKLTFAYTTPYPGLTKVLLRDGSGQIVWRGQYIDGDGPQEVRFRASYLEPGESYTFLFEYKLDSQIVRFTRPL